MSSRRREETRRRVGRRRDDDVGGGGKHVSCVCVVVSASSFGAFTHGETQMGRENRMSLFFF